MSDCDDVDPMDPTVLCAIERAKEVMAGAIGLERAEAGRELTRVARLHDLPVTELACAVSVAWCGVTPVPDAIWGIIARHWPRLLTPAMS